MNARRITTNVAASYVRVIGQVVVALLMTPILINSLGDESYGLWSIVTAFTGYLLLLDLGIVSAVTKFTAEYEARGDREASRRIVGSAVVIVVPITVMLACASPWFGRIIISFVQLDPALYEAVSFVVTAATLEVAVLVFTGIYRGILFGQQRHDVVAVLDLATLLGKAFGLWMVLSAGYGLEAMALVNLTATAFFGIGLFAAARAVLPSVGIDPRNANRATVKQVGTFGRATLVSMVAAQIIYYSDAFVVGHFLSAAAFAYYTVAWSLAEYVNRFMVAASNVFVPVFSGAATSQDLERVNELFVKATRYQLTLSNLLCVGVFVLGDAFLSVWINPDYAVVSAPVLYVLFVSQALRGPQLLSYALLQGLGKHEIYSRIDLSLAFVNLVTSIILVQMFGLIGVAIATAAVQSIFFGIIAPLLVARATHRTVMSFYLKAYGPCVVPTLALAAAMVGVEHLFPPQTFGEIFLQAAFGSAIYLTLSFRFALDAAERRMFAGWVSERLKRFASDGTS